MATRILPRRGTAAQWTTANPTLAAGELGVETDTGKIKAGTGADAWVDLPYVAGESLTSDQLAAIAAVADKADASVVTALAGTVAAKADASALTTKLAKPANPSGPAAVTVAADGTVSTTLLSGLGGGGGATLTNRGAYAESADYAVWDLFTYLGAVYVVLTAFTGGATPDFSKAAPTGIDPSGAITLDTTAVDGTGNGVAVLAAGSFSGNLLFVNGVCGGGITAGAPPGAPTGLAATPGNAQMGLAWTAPASVGDSPITDYTVQSSPAGTSTWATWAHIPSTTTSANITGLTNGSDYDFRVRAVSDEGVGPWSSVVTSTPTAPTVTVMDWAAQADSTGTSLPFGWTNIATGFEMAVRGGRFTLGDSAGGIGVATFDPGLVAVEFDMYSNKNDTVQVRFRADGTNPPAGAMALEGSGGLKVYDTSFSLVHTFTDNASWAVYNGLWRRKLRLLLDGSVEVYTQQADGSMVLDIQVAADDTFNLYQTGRTAIQFLAQTSQSFGFTRLEYSEITP